MTAARRTITFRPVTASDLAMLERWMHEPHWREWWGEPETELGYVRDMLEGRDTTRPFIFTLDGEDAGYIQYWTVRDARVEPWLSKAPWVIDLPDAAIGVDLSIGRAQYLSKGIGTAVLKAYVDKLIGDGHREIVIDPDADNKRAVRAYEKAGFRPISELQGTTGDSLIMQFDLTTASKAP